MKPLLEMPKYDLATQARFADQYKAGLEVASTYLEPELLFAARFKTDGSGERLYHSVYGDRFGFGVGALYKDPGGRPHQVVDSRSEDGVYSMVIGDNGDNTVTLRGQTKTHFFETMYFEGGTRRARLATARMGYVSVQDQIERGGIVTPHWEDIRKRPDRDKILAHWGIIYDKDAGALELRMDNLVLRVGEVIGLTRLLEQYFPSEVYANPDKANTKHDVWARANWMADFNVTWNRLVPTPVIGAPR
jgi:hypothetical protein